MLLSPLAITVGTILGIARGGSPRELLSVRVRYVPLLILGIVLQSVGELWEGTPARAWVVAVGSLLLVTGTLLNVKITGVAITGLGLTLNLMALVANGYIPIREASLAAVNENITTDTDAALIELGSLWRIEDDQTNVRQLGDIVPITAMDDVVSFGDLILAAGLVVLSMNLVLPSRRAGIGIDELLGPENADSDDDNTHSPRPDPASSEANPAPKVDLRDVISIEDEDAGDEGITLIRPLADAGAQEPTER